MTTELTERNAMALIVTGFQVGSAVAGFVAAYFWFQSTRGVAPGVGWGGSGPLQPWLDKAARNNRYGAASTGVAALFAAAANLLPILSS